MASLTVGNVFKCNVCGNIVEIIFTGGGELYCCGKAMEKMVEKGSDEGREKHLLVILKTKKVLK